MTGEQTGERRENSLQMSYFRTVSKTVSGGFVRRGFKSLPLRFLREPHHYPFLGAPGLDLGGGRGGAACGIQRAREERRGAPLLAGRNEATASGRKEPLASARR